MAKLTLVEKKKTEYPVRMSPIAAAFEAEIKRVAAESGHETGHLIRKIAEFTGLSERQIYNYRTGKTDIPATLIPAFCKQFKSNALAMAIVAMCETEAEERDGFDLARVASKTVQDFLRGGDDFLEAFDDGRIDGHELTRLNGSTATIIRDAHRLNEIAKFEYERGRAA